MQTQCPQCETIFRVSADQLQARERLVRCGRCLKVFQAEEFRQKTTAKPRAPNGPVESIVLSSTDGSSNAAIGIQTDYQTSNLDTGSELPTLSELLWGKKRSRTRPFFWFIGNFSLLVLLLSQIAWFFATELARDPQLAPWIDKYCALTHCAVLPQRDIGLIELSRTRVSPHKKYRNVLQVRASLVNRAAFSQEFPLVEVSLSNQRGEIVGRRAFSGKQYLTEANRKEHNMLPNVRFPVLIEFINPKTNASGFEVRLAVPPTPKNTDSIFSIFQRK